MVAYHHVREPLYCGIIRDLQLAPAARVLDAGSGDAFYSQLIAGLLGPAAQIVAFDCDLNLHKTACVSAPNVYRCVGDLEQSCLAPASFDAVWLCRSMHAARDPLALLGMLVPMLRPGGQLIVIENDTAHYPILPLPADFEHRLRTARMRYERGRCGDDQARQRYQAAKHLGQWLRQLGLVDLAVHTIVSEDLAPLDSAVENYWRLFLAWDAQRLEPFLSPADAAAYRATFDPRSPGYLFGRPGCYCVELTTVACARRP
jgi:SAM-dependent methyltransferase